MPDRIARWVLGGLLLASAFALGVVKIEDTDAWTHLALGRDIVQHRGFPPNERFNLPSLEMPYYNPEWLFGLAFYLGYLAAGIPGVILLKASIVTLAFFILFKDSLTPRDSRSQHPLSVVMAAAALFPFLLMVRHRFVERPDIVLMVFLGFTIYALNAYVYEGRRYLYLLPALQILWVNMHPSIIVGVVPFVAFLLGGALQRLLHERRGMDLPGTPSWRSLRTIAAVFAAVTAASLLNPYGVDVFLVPFRLAASPWFTHEIMELQAPRLPQDPAPFVVVALLGLTFIATVRRLSFISVLLVAPFVYLGLSARRFVFLLGIVAAPVLARHLRMLAGRLSARWAARASVPAGFVVTVLIATVTGLSVAPVEPFVDPLKVPGFGVNFDTVPEYALRYLDRVGVDGGVFNTYQWGGYIIWRDHPRRLPIVDGRGSVPPGLLDDIKIARASDAHLARLQRAYAFDVAIVTHPAVKADLKEEMPDVDFALSSPDWALVYWDDLALVYLRRTEALASIIARDEYRHVKPANGALSLRRKLTDRNLLAEIQAELSRNIAETQSSTGLALLGFVYNEVGSHGKAIEAFARVQNFPLGSHLYNAYQGLGFAYGRLGNMKRAIEYYKKAARIGDDPLILHNTGIALAKIGNDREAIRYFERALDKDKHLTPVYPSLISAYRRGGHTDRVQKLETAYAEALAHSQAEERFRRGVRLYLEGNLHEAVGEFKASIKVNPRNPYPRSNLGYVYFDLGRVSEAFAEQQGALDVDPDFANAHYGLALIYRNRGDYARARAHFREYLRLEPRGYWARKAQEELTRLPPR